MKWLLTLSAFLALRGAVPCEGCHPAETNAYRRTPMGASLRPVDNRSVAAFARGRSSYVVNASKHAVSRGGRTASHMAKWQIGSGSHAAGFLVEIAGRWFQSPIAFYPKRNQWDVAPGYENLDFVDFNRRVTDECLNCHTSTTQSGLAPIHCERCHGSGEAHAARPARGNIVNPARLGGAERSSVCEQCHLTGEVRVPVPGGLAYQPGNRLEDAMSIYVRTTEDLKVVSHVEQLAESACAKASPNLWCGSCHNVHGAKADIDSQCATCHSNLSVAHQRTRQGCAQCHMPKRNAVDGLHTAFTDHRISRPGRAGARRDRQLRVWRPGAAEDRNMALALLATGESAQMQTSFRQLTAAYPKYPKDPEVLAGLGFLLFLKDQHADAIQLLRTATRLRPGHSPYLQKLALAYRAAGQKAAAMTALEEAIRFDPLDETSYFLLAETAAERRVEVLERYLKLNPNHLAARAALGRP